MKVARAAALVAAFALATAACGTDKAPHQADQHDGSRERPSTTASPAQLPDLTRALVPPEALPPPVEDDLDVEECGIQPFYPCVREYFVVEDIDLEERLALVRRQARSAGWRIVSEKRESNGGVTIEIERGEYGGVYELEADDPLMCETAARCLSGTMLTVYAPPAPLPAPSEAERASWSPEKRAFVEDANVVCAETEARMRAPDDVAPVLADGLERLSALEPPSGEEKRVERILRPLRIVVKAAEALRDEDEENALPAAVALGEFIKRFNEAASRFGLDVCAKLG
jgi:hypothetical protein